MKTLTIRFVAEKALFRNLSIPSADVACELNLKTEHNRMRAERVIIGLLGSMAGYWRDFDVEPPKGSGYASQAPTLTEWRRKHDLKLVDLSYKFKYVLRTGIHRFKTIGKYMEATQSTIKQMTYHMDVTLDVVVEATEECIQEIEKSISIPACFPYLGQSECPAQAFVVRT